jgi:8-oxo-dGTP diphosphatase
MRPDVSESGSGYVFERVVLKIISLPCISRRPPLTLLAKRETKTMHPPFSGAKIALLCEDRVLTYLRDDKPSIPWPGLWDLPGGGREHGETPEQCALRETHEEFGLTLDPAWIVWRKVYPGQGISGLDTWFFVARVPHGTFEQVVFGDEGQRWEVRTVEDFLAMDTAIERLQQRLREFLSLDA